MTKLCTLFINIFLLTSISSYCQLTISGNIQLTDTWENNLYIIRVDQLGMQPSILVDSISINNDGYFQYSFQKDPQGIFYELRLPPKGGNHKSLVSGFQDNWFHVISDTTADTIYVTASADSLYYSLKIKNTEQIDSLELYKNLKRPAANIIRQMADSILKNPSDVAMIKEAYMKNLLSELKDIKKQIKLVLDTTHSKQLIIAGLYYLNEASLNQLEQSEIDKYASKLSKSEIILIQNLKNEKKERKRIGITIPNFQLNNIDDKSAFLKLEESPYTVIDFWASWCRPCRYANKNQLPKLLQTLDEYEIPLISVSIDKDKNKWKEAVIKDEINWPQYIDNELIFKKLIRIKGIPLYIIVNSSNEIIYEAVTVQQITTYLKNKIIKKSN